LGPDELHDIQIMFNMASILACHHVPMMLPPWLAENPASKHFVRSWMFNQLSILEVIYNLVLLGPLAKNRIKIVSGPLQVEF
jgi:hypothetical protein